MAAPRRAAGTRLFVVAGLLVASALVLLVGPLASRDPDGLERVAEDQGFSDTADDHRLADSPLADYAVEGVDDDRVSTGVSGVAGLLLTFGIAIAVFGCVRALRPAAAPDDRVEPDAAARAQG